MGVLLHRYSIYTVVWKMKMCHVMMSGRYTIGNWQHLVAGYDILLDQHCKPWLLEVNHSPSFSVGSVVDAAVKEAVLLDTLRLVCCTAFIMLAADSDRPVPC